MSTIKAKRLDLTVADELETTAAERSTLLERNTGIQVQLSGQDGNVFNLMAICATALRKNGKEDLIDTFMSEVRSSHSYDEALIVMMSWFDVS